MSSEQLVVVGSGTLGQIVVAQLSAAGTVPAAVAVDAAYLDDRRELLGVPIVALEQLGEHVSAERAHLVVTIGYREMNSARERVSAALHDAGWQLASYVSEHAHIGPHATLGSSVIVLDGAIVEPFAQIDDGCILWSGALIAHHTRVGAWSFCAPRATVAGGAQIGDHAFLGAGCTVRDGVTIAPRTVVGAGAVILHDTEPGSVHRAPHTPALPGIDSGDIVI